MPVLADSQLELAPYKETVVPGVLQAPLKATAFPVNALARRFSAAHAVGQHITAWSLPRWPTNVSPSRARLALSPLACHLWTNAVVTTGRHTYM